MTDSTSTPSDEQPVRSTRPAQVGRRAPRRNGDIQRYTIDLDREQRRTLALVAAEWEIDKSKIVGLGVGIPGIIDERGRTIRWPQSLGDKDMSVCSSIKDTFEKRLNIPTIV